MSHPISSLGPCIEIVSGFLPLLGTSIHLVERRGRRELLTPTRQIEIGTLLESIPDAVVIVDANQRIIDLNQSAAKMLGGAREEVRGENISEIGERIVQDNATQPTRRNKNIALRAIHGEAVREEPRSIRNPKTGENFQLIISAYPLCGHDGKPVGCLLIGRDVTELSQLQNRFSDMERHMAIGQVAAGIAHDFNNTLETISHAVVLLQASPEPAIEERQTLLRLIHSAVEHGAEIIARIRDYARSGTGEVSPVSVKDIIEDALEWTEHLRHRKNGVKLIKELETVKLVRANAADLRRVFTNLIINALQAMPEGGELTIGARTEGARVHVWIRDNGGGIRIEDQKKMFLPYFTTKRGGTGLGLSGAQKIVLGLGGDIQFHSRAGKGTQFDIFLPTLEQQARTA